jgi:BCD family chlorophyll transporter-like MFS transporter
VVVLIATFAVFALSSLAQIRPLVTPGLILLGLGLGFWNVGTLGLMMEMSPFGRAGTFLGFWTLVVTLARGIGVSSGGIVRDVALQITGNLSMAYGAVFVIGVVGLAISLWTLTQVKVERAVPEETPTDSATVLAGALD